MPTKSINLQPEEFINLFSLYLFAADHMVSAKVKQSPRTSNEDFSVRSLYPSITDDPADRNLARILTEEGEYFLPFLPPDARSRLVSLRVQLTEQEKAVREVLGDLDTVLSLVSNVFPQVQYLQKVVGFLLKDVMPQPDTPMDELKEQLTELSGQVQKGFDNVENMINKMQFEHDVANPTKIISNALNSYLRSNNNKHRKRTLFETCIQVSPCTRLDIFYSNMFRNNPRYISSFLDNTNYGHAEFVDFRSYLVNTTASLLISCTFCEQMHEKRSISVADINVNKAREFANMIIRKLAEGYQKQQDEFFPSHLQAHLRPYLNSTVDKISSVANAAKMVCDYIKEKYSISETDEYRGDNFACIVYENPNATSDNSWNHYLTNKKASDLEKRLLMIRRGKRAYMIYRPSQSVVQYLENKDNVEQLKNDMAKHNRKIS
ncbi:hypothetical protein L596_021991 [Steinernema carpocapsae]|uniref:Uncharacterized protein n=1 Tax=Steinernema carpocapsae TaxID=34508 RepID=A0A4U5MKF8_STECR|nr:hypothetical protein L596_021991 [Steinernema carpocapsae]